MEYSLGRIPQFDERSRAYPIRLMLDTSLPLRSYTWSCPAHLDQGNVGACTGFAVAHEAMARPVKVPNITTQTALSIYWKAQLLDEWPGESYSGSSVLAAIKAGQQFGWYPEYRWGFGLNDLLLTLSYRGPAVLGINWYQDMFTPDPLGIIHPIGGIAGGHAILANGVSVKNRLIRLHNSWGDAWGKGGDCFLSWDDVELLLAQEGEVCIPVKRTLRG